MELERILPSEIEKRSFEIIAEELGSRAFDSKLEPIIKRVIHTTADFDYADNLVFSDGCVDIIRDAIRNGANIVTDTQMARAGINKKKLAEFGGEVICYMSDEDVAKEAKSRSLTRAYVSMERAAGLEKETIFAIGNAPTALVSLYELMENTGFRPVAIIGVPVGFVNVVQAKELIIASNVPHIVARGRKGGSNVAAAICNALIYGI